MSHNLFLKTVRLDRSGLILNSSVVLLSFSIGGKICAKLRDDCLNAFLRIRAQTSNTSPFFFFLKMVRVPTSFLAGLACRLFAQGWSFSMPLLVASRA